MDTQSLVQLVSGAVTAPFARIVEPGAQTYWLTYVGALVLAWVYYLGRFRHRRRSVRHWRRYFLPRRLLRHPSTRLDVKLYLAGSAYMVLQGAVFIAVTPYLAERFRQFFALPPNPAPMHVMIAMVLPFFYLLVLELGYWLAHAAMHKSAVLWEFHKVHHSAEIMTPLTEWRQHPVEFLLFPLVMLPLSGLATMLCEWAFGTPPPMVWGLGLLLFLFMLTSVHLRHTHLRMGAPRWLCYVIQTPLHHHVHHSTKQEHFDKNFGYCLSLWDWAFGTLVLPQKKQVPGFGIDDTLTRNYRLRDHLLLPCARAASVLLARKPR